MQQQHYREMELRCLFFKLETNTSERTLCNGNNAWPALLEWANHRSPSAILELPCLRVARGEATRVLFFAHHELQQSCFKSLV